MEKKPGKDLKIITHLHLHSMTEYSNILVFSLTPSLILAVKPNAPMNATIKMGKYHQYFKLITFKNM